MTIPYITTVGINIRQISQNNQTILCDIYLNDSKFCVGIQNAAYPIPFGRYRAFPFKGTHPHTRLLLQNVPNHAGIEVHEGNYANQLRGCTAVGTNIIDECCFNSVKTLHDLLKEVHKYDVCYVTLSRSSDFLENKERI